MRGDGPTVYAFDRQNLEFSPRAWGWSAKSIGSGSRLLFSPRAWGWSDDVVDRLRSLKVLPTFVGMVRAATQVTTIEHGSPHVRGDGPCSAMPLATRLLFSPRAWGWSSYVHWLQERKLGSPHVRGDGPVARRQRAARRVFSPRAWGWSRPVASIRSRSRTFSPRAWGWSA